MAMGNPCEIMVCEDSVKTVLIFLLAYVMGIGVYFSTRRNYRRREEHGSAKWGNAGALNKKYRDKDPSANKLLTQNVCIGLDGKKHRRNLNILVCGGSGAGKTRFFCKPNAMQCNTSFVILDPKAKSSVTSGVCWKIKAMRCVCLTLSICTAAIVTIPLSICGTITMFRGW